VDEENFPLEDNKNEKGITYKRSDLEWFQYYAGLYIRYVQTYRVLEDSYDQMIHPQKRMLMKQMLDNCIVRMCEVKQNVIKYSTSTQVVQADFINFDEILMEMKLTPKALKIPLPRFFLDKKTARDETLEKMVRELGVSEEV
jgi:IQ and AAA domain-containing protein